MKAKQLCMMLAFASITGTTMCQQTIMQLSYSEQSPTDRTFNPLRIGSSKKRFDFTFPAGNRMILELSASNEVDSLPDIDSLVHAVWKDILNIDSLNSPLSAKRVDVVFSPLGNKTIRIQEFPQKGTIFRVKGDDITQLKVEQDTLHLQFLAKRTTMINGIITSGIYQVTFIVNHIGDIPLMLQKSNLAATVQVFKKDYANRKNKDEPGEYFSKIYAVYDASKVVRTYPAKGDLRNLWNKTEFTPYVQTAVQYVRGSWAPSAGVGFEIVHKISEHFENHFQLMWEPYFFFSKDSIKGVVLNRNDFLTFKYRISSEVRTSTREINFQQTFSFGYLIRRRGNDFEPTTFKFSLPGLQAKNVLLEPEFIFNGFLKNFSPSLKLTMYFE